MPDGFVDPYIDLRTGVLRNLVGAGTWDELRNAEGELVAMRTSEFLRELPLEPTGTLDDLRLIHRWLFRDACDWAGEVRTIEIRKAGEGAQFFPPSANIPRGIAWARSELEKDDFLVGLASRRFPAAWPTTMTTTTSCTPFARVGCPSRGSSRRSSTSRFSARIPRSCAVRSPMRGGRVLTRIGSATICLCAHVWSTLSFELENQSCHKYNINYHISNE